MSNRLNVLCDRSYCTRGAYALPTFGDSRHPWQIEWDKRNCRALCAASGNTHGAGRDTQGGGPDRGHSCLRKARDS